MKNYIGVKALKAEPMTLGEYNKFKGWNIPADEDPNKDGYLVVYTDSYNSWSPKDVFDKAYMVIGDNNTITNENVESFVHHYTAEQYGDKTTVVHVHLVNGFIISESSSCVDPKNFDMTIGTNICLDKAKDKIWGLLGFMLQSAVNGVK